MSSHYQARTGGQLIVDQLKVHGVDHVFCVPGESYLAVLDALHDSDIQVTICRQEGGAAMMAEAHGKLTGRPAACFVTRGPGATNATPGIHIAQHDSTPLLVFVGQIETGMRDRGAFQELDYRLAYGGFAKWVVEIDDASRIPEVIAHAMSIACSGRAGPVVIALPEDMLTQVAQVMDAKPVQPIVTYPSPSAILELKKRLEQAERPIIVLGGSGWDASSVSSFDLIARQWGVPIVVSMRRQMLLHADHPCLVGDLGFGPNPSIPTAIKQADLVVLMGSRLSEVPSQSYSLLDIPVPTQTLIQIHAEPAELGRVYQADLTINATPAALVDALSSVQLRACTKREAFLASLKQSFHQWTDPTCIKTPGRLQMGQVMAYLNRVLPDDSIICNGAGNYAIWLHRFYKYRGFATQLAPTSGSMGYGVPAAVGAKRIWPERTVIAFAGDGCFLMNGQEFATAVQYDLPVIVIVVDNGMYGTIRMHQEREYPGRVVATELKNPDFCAYAFAFGGHGERVETTEDFAPAFERALASKKPSIIHCLIDPEAISPSTTLSHLRKQALDAGR